MSNGLWLECWWVRNKESFSSESFACAAAAAFGCCSSLIRLALDSADEGFFCDCGGGGGGDGFDGACIRDSTAAACTTDGGSLTGAWVIRGVAGTEGGREGDEFVATSSSPKNLFNNERIEVSGLTWV